MILWTSICTAFWDGRDGRYGNLPYCGGRGGGYGNLPYIRGG
jgi:hypothetical protein